MTDGQMEKFFLAYVIEHLAARAGEPDTLMPREVKYGSNKVAAPRPFVFSLCYVGGCRRQIHSHARTQHTTNTSCLQEKQSNRERKRETVDLNLKARKNVV